MKKLGRKEGCWGVQGGLNEMDVCPNNFKCTEKNSFYLQYSPSINHSAIKELYLELREKEMKKV